MTLRKLRLRAVWLIVLPFLWFAAPTETLLAIGGVLAAVGLAIRGWSAGTIYKDEALSTAGPYAFTRNPLYLGSFVLGVGVSLTGGHWVWPAVFVLFFGATYRRTIAAEGSHLSRSFPEVYREYAAQVPAFMPRMTPWEGTDVDRPRGFRWAQYRRNREWEALLGTLSAFAILGAKLLLG